MAPLAAIGEPAREPRAMRDVQERLGGETILPGNFYRTLRRLLADGVIEEAPAKHRDEDERRRRHDGDRREVTDRVVVHLGEEARHDHVNRRTAAMVAEAGFEVIDVKSRMLGIINLIKCRVS